MLFKEIYNKEYSTDYFYSIFKQMDRVKFYKIFIFQEHFDFTNHLSEFILEDSEESEPKVRLKFIVSRCKKFLFFYFFSNPSKYHI